MAGLMQSNRRQLLAAGTGLGGALAIVGGAAAGAIGQEPAATTVDADLESFAPPEGQAVEAGADIAAQVNVVNAISVASHVFSFDLANGTATEKTAAVTRPPGAGFIVMLMSMQYGFVDRAGGTTLRERPLGEFVARVGMRGDNLVCRIRLTDINADDPVSVRVTAGVLFFQ